MERIQKGDTRKRLLPPQRVSTTSPTPPLPGLNAELSSSEVHDQSNFSGSVSIQSGAVPSFGRLSRGRLATSSNQWSSFGTGESGDRRSNEATNEDDKPDEKRRSFRRLDLSNMPVAQTHESRWAAAQAAKEADAQALESETDNRELQLQAQRHRIATLMQITQERRISEKEEQERRLSLRRTSVDDQHILTAILEGTRSEETSLTVDSSEVYATAEAHKASSQIEKDYEEQEETEIQPIPTILAELTKLVTDTDEGASPPQNDTAYDSEDMESVEISKPQSLSSGSRACSELDAESAQPRTSVLQCASDGSNDSQASSESRTGYQEEQGTLKTQISAPAGALI